MKLSHMCRRKRGFTLVHLLVVIVIILVVIAFLLPARNKAGSYAVQIKCAANLKNIGLAMMIYSNNEKNNSFPRTYFSGVSEDGSRMIDPIDCSNFGGPANSLMSPASDQLFTPIANSGKSFEPGVVPNNCVMASIFLLMKATDLTPDIFVCNSSNGTRGFTFNNPKDWSNFEDSPNWGQHMTYSFACMFPGPTAEKNGFRWSSTIANPTDFAIAADMNPGNQGGINQPNSVTFPTHSSSSKDLARGNSNNHNNAGQNVLYADGHVAWQTTPFCGVTCINTATQTSFSDNIYTSRATTPLDVAGVASEKGTLSNTAFPVDGADSYLLPTDDGTSGPTWGF